jgi:hypothetical protein
LRRRRVRGVKKVRHRNKAPLHGCISGALSPVLCQEGDRLLCRGVTVVAPDSTLSLVRHHYLLLSTVRSFTDDWPERISRVRVVLACRQRLGTGKRAQDQHPGVAVDNRRQSL